MKFFLISVWLLFAMFFLEGALSASSSCEPITISLCKMMPYNLTHFPNALSHYTQARAQISIDQFMQVAHKRCSSHLVFFLCAFHLPICAGEFTKPILPCRGLCEKVKSDCKDVLNELKLPWPAAARCNKLPSYETGVCIRPTSFVPPGKSSSVLYLRCFVFYQLQEFHLHTLILLEII